MISNRHHAVILMSISRRNVRSEMTSLRVEGLTKTIDGVKVLDNVSFIMNREDKIAFTGRNELAVTTLFKIISGKWKLTAAHLNGA